MKTLFRCGLLAAILFVLPKFSSAQVFETVCPAGTQSLQLLQTTDLSTGQLKQNFCVDNFGNITVNGGATVAPPVNSFQYNNAGAFGGSAFSYFVGGSPTQHNFVSQGNNSFISLKGNNTNSQFGVANAFIVGAIDTPVPSFTNISLASGSASFASGIPFIGGFSAQSVIIGNGGTGRCDFVNSAGTADCAVGFFAGANDTSTDTSTGQDMVGIETFGAMNKTAGHNARTATGIRVFGYSNSAGLCCPGPEQAQNIYGIEIMDQLLLSTSNVEEAGLKIHSSTAPFGGGKKWSIKADTGSGLANYGDGAVFAGGKPSFDVLAYGAVCDGATDDSTAFASAITAANATGGAIRLPPALSGCKVNTPQIITGNNVSLWCPAGRTGYQNAQTPMCFIDMTGMTEPNDGFQFIGHAGKIEGVGLKMPASGGGSLAPPAAPVLANGGGACAGSNTYFVKITYTVTFGTVTRETALSPESTFTTAASNCLQINSPVASGNATGWKAYASTNSNRETQQQQAPIAIGTNFVLPAQNVANTGNPPFSDTSAAAAVYSNDPLTITYSKIYTSVAAAPSNGIEAATSYLHLTESHIQGFQNCVNLHAFGPGNNGAADDEIVTNNWFHSCGNAITAAQVNPLNVSNNEFFLNTLSDLNFLSGSVIWFGNYQEMDNTTITNMIIGPAVANPQPSTAVNQPYSSAFTGGFINCGGRNTNPLFAINRGSTIEVSNWHLTNCITTQFIQNAGNANSIKIRGNTDDDATGKTQATWANSFTGVLEHDIDLVNATSSHPGTNVTFSGVVNSSLPFGTAVMTTAAIAAGNCGTTVTVAATGAVSTDAIVWSFNAAPAGSNAGIVSWPTANNVNFAYCSNTAQTPVAATINWRIVR